MALSEERKGELYVVSATAIFGLFPVVVTLTYATLAGFASLAWSTLFAAAFLFLLVAYRGRWRELTNPILWKYGLFITLSIGVIFYTLYFVGLEYTTPGNAAMIVYFQVFTSFVFFNIYRGEPFSREYQFGAVLMIAGVLCVLGSNWSGINAGDLLILLATFVTPIGNYFQQHARRIASSDSIVFVRSILSAVVLFAILYAWGAPPEIGDVHAVLPFLLIAGIVALGFEKILWIEGIHRISVTKAMSLASVGPFFALFFVWVILGQPPTIFQLAALVPFLLGTLLLTDQLKLTRHTTTSA